jgi:hypothetical protein
VWNTWLSYGGQTADSTVIIIRSHFSTKTIPELNIGSKIVLSPVFIVHLVLFFSFISKRKKQRAVEDDFWQWICCAQ